ncbi:MarP family serine protease [Corynebacterium epidermidicanis]|uniref:Trypsin-like peptidase domain/Colicin V production protein n=1 Tax=Corynebacterium epidermidicanis TaxID=1050174 RepID=A0A0G3GLU5_9CORY|nr:MarP family serine protease [Corynebacterium epidermidicanis]AKK02166.1 Trypsin-like peptidase domain/Colicin V production protein [Corynebacterium epidermidicanis]
MLVDAVIAVIVLGTLITGWRQGALASVLATVGVIAGLVLGAAAAPWVMSYTDSTAFRFLLAIAMVVLLVGVGNMAGGIAGNALRNRMKLRSTQRFDSVFGALFQALATLVVVWLVAIPLATVASGSFAQQLHNSRVLREVDRYAPSPLHSLPNQISAMLNESGLPPLTSPFNPQIKANVLAPKVEVAHPEVVQEIRPSVVHVLGQASQCRHLLSGSGFVVSDDYVFTNAHVVAGTEAVKLDTVLGVKPATVVFYDPAIDIAVLHAPGLGLAPLTWAPQPAESGVDTVIMGFPGSGPFTATTARVRERITINGPDIYALHRIDREAYTIRGEVRQGNSGGPMVTEDGQLLGMVFGAAVDSSDTGYALTGEQIQRTVGDYQQKTEPVATGECVAK